MRLSQIALVKCIGEGIGGSKREGVCDERKIRLGVEVVEPFSGKSERGRRGGGRIYTCRDQSDRELET